MSDRPWMPLWISAFIGDTQDLSDAEVGAYMLLLMAAWCDPDGSLPDCHSQLSRIARTDRRNWQRRRAPRILHRYFKIGDDGRWRQKRLSAELEKARKYFERRKKQPGNDAEARPGGPVENPVKSCGKVETERVLNPSHNGHFANEINGRPTHILHKSQNLSKSLSPSDRARASGNAAQKKQELKKGFLQESPAAPYRATRPPRPASNAGAKRDTPPAGNPRTRWEAELAANLGPDDFAQAIPLLEADKALCARATAAERRQPGSGAHVAAAGLLKLTRARP